MIGIYIITNKITGLSYIGQSVNIEKRIKSHKNRAFSVKVDDLEFNKTLYRAMRKYGLENFTFDVLEQLTDKSQLNQRERYWINFYNTYFDGYNETFGGDGVSGFEGESHPKHKLTEIDVIDIRKRWATCKESISDIYEDYKNKVKPTGFKKIYTWQTWKSILPELFTKDRVDWHNEQAKKSLLFTTRRIKSKK